MRQAVLYQDEDGMWVAEVPSLPGCLSQGETRDESLTNIAEAIQLWIETANDLGEAVPADPGTLEVAEVVDPAA